MPDMLFPLLRGTKTIYIVKTVILPALVGSLPSWDARCQVASSATTEDGVVKGHVLVQPWAISRRSFMVGEQSQMILELDVKEIDPCAV